MSDIAKALYEVILEYNAITEKHGGFCSPHEGYAVTLEELEELWDHVKENTAHTPEARAEACQVAACAIKFMTTIAK